MQITKQEANVLARIISRKRKVPLGQAFKIIESHNGYLKDLTKKKEN